MASNTPTTDTKADPLGFMIRLSPDIYHLRPSPSASTDTLQSAPELIIIASWMGARDAHIAKYIHPYRSLYPSSEILLLRSEAKHFTRPVKCRAAIEDAAVPVLRAAIPYLDSQPATDTDTDTDAAGKGKGENPRLLIHIFSGGGSFSVFWLRTLVNLPPYAVVYDSAPPQYHYKESYGAISAALPSSRLRVLLAPLVHFWCVLWWLRHRVYDARGGGPLGRIAAAHNEREGRARGEVRRGYVYSEGDEFVGWRDVEGHAEEARRRGFEVVMEKFEGSGHVNHARVDGERYWGLVKRVWEGR
ncbi:hypothetical protein QBC34DRAFT_445254 [Podospora aff. communis PSN243]|uniref:Indole-diterpene biosynthesis protein PaxU n=1 Tax=Podospora aff. communis PSN243 TaxID=3040156 RepID=A0AAV9H3P0_9PEZI|nr:hypothetical protein QBC34DRAFT_445254 [Podospora aff. communis PSN243]